MISFKSHKPGQARLTRTLTFLAGLYLVLWGCRSLVYAIPRIWGDGGRAWNELLGGAAPEQAWWLDLVVFRERFGPATTAALLVGVAVGLWWYAFMNSPRWADLLIDMEAELRKVSWPTFSDAWQSTLVVTGFTALVIVLVFVYDLVIKGFIDLIPVRGA